MSDGDIKVVGLSGSKGKGKINWKVLSAVIGIVVLSLGIIAGILLVRQQQDLREKAQQQQCPGAQQCPSADGKHLLNCNPPEADNSPQDSLCRVAGQTSVCGQENFCCPAPGGKWTKDMSKCSTSASPTAPAYGTMTCSDGFSDTFDTTIDTTKWTVGQNVSIVSGSLSVLSKPGTPAGATALNKIKGDFVMTIDSPSISITGQGGKGAIVFMADNGKNFGVGRGVDTVGGNLATTGNESGNATITSGQAVSFKIERKAGKFTLWYKTTADFVLIKAFTGTLSEDLTITLSGITLGAAANSATITYDNIAISCSTTTATATATSTSGSKTATPTATSTSGSGSKTATPTATSTSGSGSKTATPTSTSSSGSATTAPIPVTGSNLPTIIGAGFGVIMLIISLGLAL